MPDSRYRSNAGAVFTLKYHLVWCPKYRKPLLVGAVAARVDQHVKNQRSDFQHRISRQIVNTYDLIAVEDLNIKGLAGGMLAKSVHDAGWGSFLSKLACKVEETGRQMVKVRPNGTSQRCPCGAAVPKTLSQRWHGCLACGMSVSRNHASALEILRLGLSLREVTWPDGASVSRVAVSFS